MLYMDGCVLMQNPDGLGDPPMTRDEPLGLIGEIGSVPAQAWLREYQGGNRAEDLAGKTTGNGGALSTVTRFRVFEDGRLATYGPERGRDMTPIDDGEAPDSILMPEDVYGDHGLDAPFAPPNFEAGRHICAIDVQVANMEMFRDHFGLSAEMNDIDRMSAMSQLALDYGLPFDAGPFGATLEAVDVELDLPHITIRVTATIDEPRLFNQRVAAAGRRHGHDSNYVPASAGDAIFEAWCGLNDAQAPADMGLEILDWRSVPSDASPIPSF